MNLLDLPASFRAAIAGAEPRAPALTAHARAGSRWRWVGLAAAGVALAAVGFGYALGPSPAGTASASAASPGLDDLAALHTPPPDDAVPTRRLVSPQHLLDREPRRSSADEAALFEIYGLLATGRADAALPLARRLSAERPAFGLGQLVYADLLTAQSASPGRETGFGAAPVELTPPAKDRIAELTAEAQARVQAAAFAPPPGTVPAPFLRLDPSVRHAIAVDVGRSRLYVLENGVDGPRVVREFYASIGKLGMLKQAEGDQRTPLGVYFVTRELAPARLATRYGSRALVLNYPNPYDRVEGRTGDGIWLHGVAAADYSRPPLATDGCIALANPQMDELATFIAPQGTPILVADHLDWVAPANLMARQGEFMADFERWRAARDGGIESELESYYASALTVPEPPALGAPWRQLLKDEQARRRPGDTPRTIGGMSIVRWKDQRDLMIVTFVERAAGSADGRTRRQYWVKQGDGWRIFYERALG